MPFPNFDRFAFMYDQLARPLEVYEPVDTTKRDKRGLPLTGYKDPVSVTEPLVANSDPNLTYHNAGGGQISVGEMYWESRTSGYPEGTKLVTTTGHAYKVISHGLDVSADLTYYQVQEVGGNEQLE